MQMNNSVPPVVQTANSCGPQLLHSGPPIAIVSVVGQSQEQVSKPSPASTRLPVNFSRSPEGSPKPGTIISTISSIKKGMHEDVDMDDEDEDDLYGPLPEELELVPRHIKPSAPDMAKINEGPFDSASHPREQHQRTSWMHGRFAHISGDSWDRLQQRKRSPVVNRPRVKVQAKKLDSNHTTRVEDLVNFSIHEWINMKRGK